MGYFTLFQNKTELVLTLFRPKIQKLECFSWKTGPKPSYFDNWHYFY